MTLTEQANHLLSTEARQADDERARALVDYRTIVRRSDDARDGDALRMREILKLLDIRPSQLTSDIELVLRLRQALSQIEQLQGYGTRIAPDLVAAVARKNAALHGTAEREAAEAAARPIERDQLANETEIKGVSRRFMISVDRCRACTPAAATKSSRSVHLENTMNVDQSPDSPSAAELCESSIRATKQISAELRGMAVSADRFAAAIKGANLANSPDAAVYQQHGPAIRESFDDFLTDLRVLVEVLRGVDQSLKNGPTAGKEPS